MKSLILQIKYIYDIIIMLYFSLVLFITGALDSASKHAVLNFQHERL